MNTNIQDTRKFVDIYNMNISRKSFRTIKRILDVLGALVGCILLIPLTLVIWLANIIAKDNGPVFYVQKRIGKCGKPFKMYKYRSMVVEADKKLKSYLLENPEADKEFKEFRKLKNDPRITTVGKFLRQTSLDEFPQFINVLKGDMSLVGPRPYLPRERRVIKKYYDDIIKIKPALTGPWQVNGRSEKTLEERMQMDIEYIKNENFINDIKYILKTVLKIFNADKGAI